MDDNSEEIPVFGNRADYKNWVICQDWYQTIRLENGIVTPGKFRTDRRLSRFERIDFTDRSVLDIGCNSGQYSLFAKRAGAGSVTGIDIDERRIFQARTLARNEGLDIDFHVRGIEDVASLGRFDIVICIAVITEVENVLAALCTIRDVTGEQALLEMGLARPVAYISGNRRWWRRDKKLSRLGRVAEAHRHQHAGWVVYPSLQLVKDVLGEDFHVEHMGKGLRYDLVYVTRQ